MKVAEPFTSEEILRAVAEGTASTVGEGFFRSLAQHLATALGVRHCFLTECLEPSRTHVSVLAGWSGQGFTEQFEYELAGTPCQQVLAGEVCLHSRGVRSLFPEDTELRDLDAESYAGVPFQDTSGKVIGHLAVLDVEPFDEDGPDLPILKVFAARAGAELERRRTIAALEASERTLRESEARLRQIIDLVPHFIFAKDCEGRFILVNQAVADVFGTTVEELKDRAELDFAKSAEEARHFRDDDLEVIARGEPKIIQEQITDHHGRVRYLQTTKIPFTCANSDLPSVLGVSVDITARKRAEDERRKLDEQMRQAQKLESLGVLAGGIAHDFNNLLAGILGNASLALEKLPLEAPVRSHLQGVEDSAKRAADLSNQMLAYSGRGRFVVRRVDLAEVVPSMIELVQSSIAGKAELIVDMKADLPAIEADVTELRQLVMNLILNAADALGDGGGEVTVSARAVEADRHDLATSYLDDGLPEGRYVALEVTDTGCGMDAETRARIFDPFFTTKFSGRGLGLAAVLGIVRGHGGAIAIDTEPGRGTTFRVLFPASESPAEALSADDAHTEVRGEGRLVLVVDDDVVVRQVSQGILEHYGFRVLCAQDGLSALESVRRHASEIGVVLLDMTMPRMDGIETLSALRREGHDVAVVLTSGFSESEAISRLEGQARVRFIQKPFLPADLGRVIVRALEAGATSAS